MIAAIAALVAIGSSPLTRGKRRGKVRLPIGARLIPAHAGKTLVPGHRIGAQMAHPRSRGENPDGVWGDASDEGSSPLTRGKHELLQGLRVRLRLIPAHAGKTT